MRKVSHSMMHHVAGVEIPEGCMVSHVTTGGVWRVIQLAQTPQLLDWFNDPKRETEKPALKGSPYLFGKKLHWREAWQMARFSHTSCLTRNGVAEMTHPEARVRTWVELVGSELRIMRPKVSSIALQKTAENMRLVASSHAQYPKKELVASWWRAGKWLRKWLGTEKFDKYFTDKDQNVCSGTYVDCLINACGFHATDDNRNVSMALSRHHITALTPAFLAWCMPEAFELVAEIEII